VPFFRSELRFETRGHHHVLDVTGELQREVDASGVTDGLVNLFVPGSTGGLTTIEFEDGVIQDLENVFELIVPSDRPYLHNQRWGDGNGHSHVRAALLGPSLTVPVSGGRLALGTWQQLVFVDFDNRGRSRSLVVTVGGE